MRYPFIATFRKQDKSTTELDDQGNPVNSTGDPVPSPPYTFPCDYQVSVNTPLFSSNGSFVKVSFILFVTKNLRPRSQMGNPTVIDIEVGDSITCESVTGDIVNIFHGKSNDQIWVK